MGFFQTFVTCVALLAAAAPVAADVIFSSPAGGTSVPAGQAIKVIFKDSGSAPSISDLKSYQLFLCAGGDTPREQVDLLTIPATGSFSSLSVITPAIANTVGGPTTNAYFFKMISVAVTGGTVTNFSPRFSFQGMKGTFPANVVKALSSIESTDAPPTINDVGAAAPAAPPAAAGAFSSPYSMQTGTIKYAPMLVQPGSKITAKKTAPLYPTSAFDIARTYLPPAKVLTTLTEAPTGVVNSIANTAAAQPMPMDDMQKFLHRWKD